MKATDRLFAAATGACAFLAVGTLVAMVATILAGGWERLGLSFLVSPMEGTLGGGILYQILGTGLLLLTAATIVVPFAAAVALLYTVYLRRHPSRRFILVGLHVLNATPSILFGILGFLFFVKGLGWEKSWLSGGVILATMILPTVAVALIDRIQTLPRGYLDAARALGFGDGEEVTAVVLPYAWGGLLTGLILGLARAAGETAPILFTAAVFSGATLPTGVVDSPVLALPYHIFNLAQDVYGAGALTTAWATAAALTGLVVAMSLLAVPFRARSHEEAKK